MESKTQNLNKVHFEHNENESTLPNPCAPTQQTNARQSEQFRRFQLQWHFSMQLTNICRGREECSIDSRSSTETMSFCLSNICYIHFVITSTNLYGIRCCGYCCCRVVIGPSQFEKCDLIRFFCEHTSNNT